MKGRCTHAALRHPPVWAVWLLVALGLLPPPPAAAQAAPAPAPPVVAPAPAVEAASPAAPAPLPLQVLSPRADGPPTTAAQVHVLGRTAPGARVQVGGQPAQVFGSGIFALDHVAVDLGSSAIVVQAQSPSGQISTQTLQVLRVPPPAAVQWPADRLYINGSSLQPDQLMQLAPGQTVEVAVQATPGQWVRARLPGEGWRALHEASPGRYRASLAFSGSADVAAAAVKVQLQGVAAARGRKPHAISSWTPGWVGQWRADPDRLWAVGEGGAGLLHGLHDVRLGGPYLAELLPGTLLRVTGQQGGSPAGPPSNARSPLPATGHLRVQLAPDSEAWVAASEGRYAPAGTAPPQAHFTSLSVAAGADGDVVHIPLSSAVPFAVQASAHSHEYRGGTTAGAPGIDIDLYSTHHATTWISHRANARVVREVTAEQRSPGRVRLHLSLQGPRLWGWRVERTADALRVIVRPPPVPAREGPPLAGLRVALEPGHGGPTNLGAVGPTGTPEKEFNRWTALALQQELESAGAQVVMVRAEDHNPSLLERALRAVAADAHVYISLHANAADTSRGHLRVSGTSTYYKHAHSRDLAAAVQRRLLQETGLNDFGLVGNFNYTPIRLLTWMPAVLVEQAFVSHPGDEARLLDPAFRQQVARAVRQGLQDFLGTP